MKKRILGQDLINSTSLQDFELLDLAYCAYTRTGSEIRDGERYYPDPLPLVYTYSDYPGVRIYHDPKKYETERDRGEAIDFLRQCYFDSGRLPAHVKESLENNPVDSQPEPVAEAQDRETMSVSDDNSQRELLSVDIPVEVEGSQHGLLSVDAINRGKELKPIVVKLYELTMAEHKPLMNHKPEACLKTASAILDDDPTAYKPISKADLTAELFTQNPSSARRDFVGQLLQRLLKRQGLKVSNYQTLYRQISESN